MFQSSTHRVIRTGRGIVGRGEPARGGGSPEASGAFAGTVAPTTLAACPPSPAPIGTSPESSATAASSDGSGGSPVKLPVAAAGEGGTKEVSGVVATIGLGRRSGWPGSAASRRPSLPACWWNERSMNNEHHKILRGPTASSAPLKKLNSGPMHNDGPPNCGSEGGAVGASDGGLASESQMALTLSNSSANECALPAGGAFDSKAAGGDEAADA